MNEWIIVAIAGAVFFAASIRELPEQIIVGALAYMIANGHDWHTAIVIAIALAAAALTIILQSYDLTYWISSAIFSAIFTTGMYTAIGNALAAQGTEFDIIWKALAIVAPFLIFMACHATKKYIWENMIWVRIV